MGYRADILKQKIVEFKYNCGRCTLMQRLRF